MSGLEGQLSSTQEALLSSLDFRLGDSANYVTRRRMGTIFYPSGASTFTHSGVRVARFQITSQEWLDMSSLRVQLTLKNTHASNPLYPRTDGLDNGDSNNGSPAIFFDRVRVFAANTVVDDVLYHGRNHMILHKLMPKNWTENADSEGLIMNPPVGSWVNNNASFASAVNAGGGAPGVCCYIPAGKSYTCQFKPITLSLIRCKRHFPVWAAPLTFEFYLSDAAECLTTSGAHSQSYEIQNMQIICDSISLDSQLQNSYVQMLMSGKGLSLPVTSFFTQYSSVPTGSNEFAIPVTRALSRLKAAFITFGEGSNDPTRQYHPDHQLYTDAYKGKINDGTIRTQLAVGSLLYPEGKPCDNTAWHWSNLQQCLGLLDSSVRTISISGIEFLRFSYIVGILLEKVVGGFASGLNLRSGDLLRLQVGGMPAGNATDRVWITLVADTIIELSEKGCNWYQ